ncbi:MAG: hypothetical protein ACT4P7_05480 [Gemmatimonadaceae bacterium]
MLPSRSLLAAAALALGCLNVSGPEFDLPSGPGKRVLFIGNSLTYVNNLPSMLTAVAHAAGDTFQVRSVAFPDFALEDHWAEGSAVRALKSSSWDVVVMQQGPSSLPENQVFLKTWTVNFDPVIRASGAVPALYMVWPSLARQGDWPGVKAAYKNAAVEVKGLFLPAGEAWRVAIARYPTLGLYGSDGFHPSETGTLLAALVIYERISGRSVVGLPSPSGMNVPLPLLQQLQGVAHEVVEVER